MTEEGLRTRQIMAARERLEGKLRDAYELAVWLGYDQTTKDYIRRGLNRVSYLPMPNALFTVQATLEVIPGDRHIEVTARNAEGIPVSVRTEIGGPDWPW